MKTEAALLSEIAAATSFREQAALVAELDTLRTSKTAQAQADRDWDAAGAVVEATLSPVLTHSFHTASTDWLSEVETAPREDVASAMHTEASLWFGKTSSMVKADDDEFAEQAKGYARRIASQYGERAEEAGRAFLDYVAFLHRREAASGLDQIQQTTAPDGVTNKPTQLPTEPFDNFAPDIDPMNQGVDEMQSSENAPLLQEILQEGGGSGQGEVPNHHDTAPATTQNPMGGNGMQVGYNGSEQRTASLIDAPTVAQGYLYNLDDFLRAEAALKAQASRETDDQEDHSTAPSAAVVKEAASSLPQIQQVVDVHDAPAPTPMPTDVMFPLIPYFQGEHSTEDDQRKESALRVEADMFGQNGPASPANVGSDNPILGETHNKKVAEADEPSNAMEKAELEAHAKQVFATGADWAKSWTPDQPLVALGSPEFEAGVYAGMSENRDHQDAFIQAHAALEETEYAPVAERINVHAAFTANLRAEGATTTDLDTMDADTNPNADGDTPINGRGTVPPLAGGMDPAAPGGASPYNGAEPFGHPVAPDPGWVDPRRRMAAFRATVAANLAQRS